MNKVNDLAIADDLIQFLHWYWENIDGRPYYTTATEIVEDYLNPLPPSPQSSK